MHIFDGCFSSHYTPQASLMNSKFQVRMVLLLFSVH
uniref:Uncharacterized protein n=1 Tax=Rhizophora mucronata TaxID=61149 RepID=A0A2P2P8I9_RHIMU